MDCTNPKGSVVSVNIQKSLIRQIKLPKNSLSNGTSQITFALCDNVFLFLFLFSVDSCDVQDDGGKKKGLSVSVGASCFSN